MRRSLPACLVVLVVFACTPPVMAQGFDTGYFRTNDYPRSNSLTFTPVGAPAAEQWFTDDPYVVTNIFVTNKWVTKGVGDTTLVSYVSNYTVGARTNSSNSVTFGTYAWSASQYYDYLPGRTNPSLFKWFPSAAINSNRTATFVAEFSIIRNTDVAFPNKDRFGFELFAKVTNAGTTNLASLARFDFNPLAAVLTNANTYLFEWRKDGVQQSPGVSGLTGNWPLDYATRYRLTATVKGSQFDLVLSSLSAFGPTGSNVTTVKLVDRGQLTSGFSVADFNTLAVNWRLTSTNPFAPGSKNYILLNRLTVQPVPTAVENWLVAAGWPSSTPLGSRPAGQPFSYLEQYAMGAAAPDASFEKPSFKQLADGGTLGLELISTVRTNEPAVTVVGEAAGNLEDFSVPGATVAVQGSAAGVDQTGVASGCERRAFRAYANGSTRIFLRLRVQTAE